MLQNSFSRVLGEERKHRVCTREAMPIIKVSKSFLISSRKSHKTESFLIFESSTYDLLRYIKQDLIKKKNHNIYLIYTSPILGSLLLVARSTKVFSLAALCAPQAERSAKRGETSSATSSAAGTPE